MTYNKDQLVFDPISMKVDKLDEYIDGYANTFDEEYEIKLKCRVEEIRTDSLVWEEAFGTISFSARLRLDFTNPMREDYLSASVLWAIRGSASLILTDGMALAMKLNVEQKKVVDFKTYFITETTFKEFSKSFDHIAQKLILVINKRLSEGTKLPIGAGIRSTSVPGDKKVHINKDMIIMEVGEVSIAPILKTSKFE